MCQLAFQIKFQAANTFTRTAFSVSKAISIKLLLISKKKTNKTPSELGWPSLYILNGLVFALCNKKYFFHSGSALHSSFNKLQHPYAQILQSSWKDLNTERRLFIYFLSLHTVINCQKVVKQTLLRDKLISYQFMCIYSLIQSRNSVLNNCPNHQSDKSGSLWSSQ